LQRENTAPDAALVVAERRVKNFPAINGKSVRLVENRYEIGAPDNITNRPQQVAYLARCIIGFAVSVADNFHHNTVIKWRIVPNIRSHNPSGFHSDHGICQRGRGIMRSAYCRRSEVAAGINSGNDG
jgi:hypothetical protein